jgi:DNA polymerase III delta prime subunit
MGNEAIALYVRQKFPQASTTPASVSSIKSRLKSQIALGMPMAGGSAAGAQALTWASLPEADEDVETLEEAKARINVRYNALGRMARRLVKGQLPSLIVSGPPGLGKSHTIREAIDEMGDLMQQVIMGVDGAAYDKEEDVPTDEKKAARFYDIISGSITAVGLYQALWYTRKGGVLVLDDLDEIFRDEVCLNLLKAALDSGKERRLSWRKEAQWLEEYGIDKSFDYQGHVIFLTNIDFEAEILKQNKMAEHFKALIDRSMYLCLTLRTKRDFMIRIRQVAEGENGMLVKNFGLTFEQSEEVLDFVTEHQARFYNLSLRLVGQVANCMRADPEGWVEDVEATKMRTK